MSYRLWSLFVGNLFGIFFIQASELEFVLPSVKFSQSMLRDKRSFVKRTHDYFYTAINGLENAESVRHLISIAESITPKLSLSNCIRVLDSSYAIYQQALEEYKENETHKAQLELVYCALLSRVSVIFSASIKSQLLIDLTMLDNAIQYWEFQRHHPMYYFFHKAPKKWINKQLQAQEIREKLELLCAMNNEYSRMLGLLSSHLDFFTDSEPVEKQYQWLAQLVSIAYQVCGNKEWVPDGKLSCTRVQVYIQEAIPFILKHPEQFKKEIKPIDVPPHFERYWTLYLIGTGIGACTARYFNNHPGKINEWQHDVRQAVVNLYHKHLENPLHRIKGAVWDKKIEVDAEGEVEKITELFEKFTATFPDSVKVQEEKSKIQETYRNIHRDYVLDYACKKGNFQTPDCSLNAGVDDLDIKPAKELLRNAVHNYSNVGYTGIKEHTAYVARIAELIAEITAYHTGVSIAAAKDLIKPVLERIARRAGEVELLLLQNRLNFAAILLLPVLGIGYGGFKIIKKLGSMFVPSSYDYHIIKNGVDKIANILLESKEEDTCGNVEGMTYTALGKLIYCTYALQNQARYIPENKRDQFLHHLTCLNSSYLTVAMKYDYIDQMYREYGFLWQPNHEHRKIYKL